MDLFAGEGGGLVRKDGVSDWILKEARGRYGNWISKEDIFYYVYGYLHNREYRTLFQDDLKKMLPRLPLVEGEEEFKKWMETGRYLAELHLNYESLPAHPDVEVLGDDLGYFEVEKMRFGKRTNAEGKNVEDKTVILYNLAITLKNIPLKAYEYVVNGKSAIEWVMERYQKTVHKESSIENNPNDWSK